MQINGRWVDDDRQVYRPYIFAEIETETGDWIECPLLVDTGADRTVLSADVLSRLGRATGRSPIQLGGIGGTVETLQVQTKIKLTKIDGTTLLLNGYFSAFSDPAALDSPVLGRDVLNRFTLIVDYEGKTVCLLHGLHRYVIQGP
jgi:predicted aspartyl protease